MTRSLTSHLASTCLPLLAAAMLYAHNACAAQDAGDSLESHKTNLQAAQQDLNASQEKKKDLENTAQKTEKELASISQEAQDTATLIQEGENKLIELEEQLSILNVQRIEKEIALKKRGKELSGMVGAMIRLGRAPQEAVLVMPQGLAGKIQASRALGMMSESMRTEIEAITQQVAELQALEEQIAKNKKETEQQNQKLEKKRVALEASIKQRQDLLQQIHGEELKAQQRIAELSRKTKDLSGLIKKIEDEREKLRLKQLAELKAAQEAKAKAEAEQKRLAKNKSEAPTPTASTTQPNIVKEHDNDVSLAKGSMRLPVAGRIAGRYGQKRNANDTLKGIQIASRENAQVTAPASGEVLFTGPFMDYGKVVIIRHNARYHTLLAGLSNINCRVGQNIRSGEPIGTMGSSGKKQLYVELRSNGTPVDPVPWLQSGGTFAKK